MRVALSLFKRRLHQFCISKQNVQSVSTLSPLTSAFNTKPSRKSWFHFKESNVGLFNIPELTTHSGFEVLQARVEQQVKDLVREACSPDRNRKMVVIFDELSDCICRLADMADFVRVSHPDHQYKEAAQLACLQMGELVEKLNTSVSIYKALKDVIENGDVVETTDIDKRVAELFLFDFEQSGIHLEEHKRLKFVKMNDAIAKISNNFMDGTQRPTATSDAMNISQKHRKVIPDSSYLSSTHYETPMELTREASYKIFLYPRRDQEELLQDLLEGRCILANLVGFPSYAHRTLRGTLADTPENVMKFLESVSEKMKPGAEKDYSIMKQMKSKVKFEDREHDDIKVWDPPYFTYHVRSKMPLGVNISEYFSLGACMEGLNNLFQKLFDVSLENVMPARGEVWGNDVYKLAVVHARDGVLGYIYCDFYQRSFKPNQDCHFTIQGGRMQENGEYQVPKVVLHLNLEPPSVTKPSLLTPGNMENLFHEFGHAMHSMLGRTHYQHVTGTRCSIDFAEVPSVLMEYFAADPRVVKSFAKHYKTEEPLSDTVLEQFCLNKRAFIYSEMQLQVFYAILDQVYHGLNSRPESTTDILKEVQKKHYGIPYVENTAWQHRFGHLVGYGGKYYSYLMSRAIASRIWRQCFQADPFSRENGEQYRQKLLAHGGEQHPAVLVEDLLGEKPTIDFMVDSLMEDLKTRSAY